MADEEDEVVDPKTIYDAKCAHTPSCMKLQLAYEKCAERIEAKGHGNCTGQFMDYVACVDNCVRVRPSVELPVPHAAPVARSAGTDRSRAPAAASFSQAKDAIMKSLK